MPKTTRLEVTDGARQPNIMKLSEVNPCDFFQATTETGSFLLQKAATQPAVETVSGWDITTASMIPLPADLEVDVIEEVSVKYIND